jgi:organic hydroperoxide reductase OsmC/OhrA
VRAAPPRLEADMSESAPHVTLRQRDAYQFDVEFAPQLPLLRSDEPPPLGQGNGPTPAQLLLAAVANCMSSSLLFALGKFKNDARGVTTTASAEIGRNDAGRLRVQRISVRIQLGAAAAELQHLDRILGQFEEFCTVGQSVRAGIPTDIEVRDGTGTRLN